MGIERAGASRVASFDEFPEQAMLPLVQQAPDPVEILNSMGEVVYDWEIATDRLTWGANAAEVLDAFVDPLPATGIAYAEWLDPASLHSRFDIVMGGRERDIGHGVAFETVYGVSPSAIKPSEAWAKGSFWFEDRGRWFAGADGRPSRAHGVIRLREGLLDGDERRLGFLEHPPVVKTLSRLDLVAKLETMLQAGGSKSKPISLLLLRGGSAASISYSFGFGIAEELTLGLAEYLRTNLRGTDILARYSDKTIAIVLDDCSAKQAANVAGRIVARTSTLQLATSAGRFDASVWIGGVTSSAIVRDAAMMLNSGEEALEKAVSSASKRIVAYQPDLLRETLRKQARSVAQEIVASLDESRLVLAYQPIVSATTRETIFHEALTRLRRDDGTLVTPAAIFPVAEQIGLVQRIDRRVFELAIARLVADPQARLSVNMSVISAHNPEWVSFAHDLLGRHRSVAERLIVEITETVAIQDLDTTRIMIADLKQFGVKIAMDDFGAGHSSFRNLRHLGIDLLKIDGAFVQNLVQSADDRFFVRTLAELARHLGIPVVAEWVEDEESAAMLAGWGVDYLQGHLFGKAEM